MKIAYIMSRFPKITETFILFEMLELQRLGAHIEVFPLIREREGTVHPEARSLVSRAHFCRVLSFAVLASQAAWLARSPRAYLRAWWRALSGNLRSPGFLARAIVIVPIAAHFARQMQEQGIEHVHGTWATHPALAAYVIRLLTGLPYSFTAHSHEIYVDRTMLEEKIRGAEFVITISEYNRALLRDLYGPEVASKLCVIRCGTDTSTFKPRPHARNNDRFLILCIASLQAHKGHRYLLDACAELRLLGVNFECVLVGEGEDRWQIESWIRERSLSTSVKLLGRQPRSAVVELLAHANVLTLQSVMLPSGMSEGIPVALMEAMASGVPVIATAIRGVPELVEHGRTGLLIPHSDAGALASALLTLQRSPELRQRLSAAAREKVVREFNLGHSAEAVFRLFESTPGLPQSAHLHSGVAG